MAISNGTDLETVPLIIDGKPSTATPSAKFSIFNLEQHKDVLLAESADVDAANRAAASAWAAFKTWKDTSGRVRRRILLRYAELLREHEEDLVAAQCLETSVIKSWAKSNVHLAADMVDEIASGITRLEGTIPQTHASGTLALAFSVPVGPVLTIAPWNSSVILGVRALVTPIAAGCTVVLKSSELCPKTHGLLYSIFVEAGLPKSVINVLQTRREDAPAVTEALIAHPAIRKVEFVGSAPVGRIIGQLGGKHLKPVLMELGGKGPAIVLADADLEDAAQKCIAGAFLHHGQLCFSTERVIVIESVAEKFQKLLQQFAPGFETGSGISERIISSSVSKLQDAKDKGAKFLVGGPDRASKTALKPTIVTGVTKSMQLADEEAFGPSFSLYIAKNDDEAIEMANDTQYGLNAAVHSSNMQHALEVAKQIETATIHVNCMTAHDEPTLPVGGIKGSGWGRNNALWGLKEFTEIRLVTFGSHLQAIDAN